MNNEISQALQDIHTLPQSLKTQLDREQESLTGLAKRLWAQQEAEKARLSRELHDGVGQLLTNLTRRLHDLSEGDSTHSEQHELYELHAIAKMALADVRQLSRLMSPTLLDDLGLKPALNWLCRSVLGHENIHYTCSIDAPEGLSKHVGVLLFRIAQEALTNSVKHAGASAVQLSVLYHHNIVRMQIHDDGCGFAKQQIEPGIGLSSIEDRAKAFNASLQIDTAPGQGTHIIITVPI
ncbi:sensor histidine kinase [Salinimonas sediminis]|uniref:sensor histidine kinase n=1 Tax=Salinimonas sediminis TaxID=2303538 RepID=UPI00159C6C0E|nr:sensor histidine kinase [Salinimonas sediminis]